MIKETKIIMNKIIPFTYKQGKHYYEVHHIAGLIVYDSNKERLLKNEPPYQHAFKILNKLEKQ